MFSPNRFLTPKEQTLLLGVALAVLVGSGAIFWLSRHGTAVTAATVAAEKPAQAKPAPAPAEVKPPAAPAQTAPATIPPPVAPPSTPAAVPSPVLPPPPAVPVEIAVAVRGGVQRPGLYRLTPDSRIADLIMKAGGASAEADLSEINLAARLMDGTTLTVPVGARISEQDGRISGHGSAHRAAANPAAYLAGTAMPEATGPTPGRSAAKVEDSPGSSSSDADTAATVAKSKNGAAAGGGRINLNTATQKELEALPGIGKVLAGQIIEQRQTQPFKNVEDLDKVPGIGPKRLEAVRNLVTVE